jgi:hypothetical protein
MSQSRPRASLTPLRGASNAPPQVRLANVALGLRPLPGRRVRAIRRAAGHPVDPAAEPLLRILRGRVHAQSESLPDVQEPQGQHVLCGVPQYLLRLPDVRLDTYPQPESPQVRKQGGRRDHHVAVLEEEYLARREHLLLRVLFVAGQRRATGPFTARSSASRSPSSEGRRSSSLSASCSTDGRGCSSGPLDSGSRPSLPRGR